MKKPLDLWEDIGSIQEEELAHVITRLFSIYEAKLQNNPSDSEALNFFKHLSTAITQTCECNLNRR